MGSVAPHQETLDFIQRPELRGFPASLVSSEELGQYLGKPMGACALRGAFMPEPLVVEGVCIGGRRRLRQSLHRRDHTLPYGYHSHLLGGGPLGEYYHLQARRCDA
jgi:hypothetical protein